MREQLITQDTEQSKHRSYHIYIKEIINKELVVIIQQAAPRQ